MSERFVASLAMGLLLAGSSPAFAQTHHIYVHHPIHHAAPGMTVANATSSTVYPAARPWLPYPYNYHETDGLSRNPNDCAVYGCVDNN